MESFGNFTPLITTLVIFSILFLVPPVRRIIFTRWIMAIMSKVLPKMGQTEKIALEAGTVWWDGELFSGKPNWKKLHEIPNPKLSEEEQSFLSGPVEELCKMIDDWNVSQERDLSPEAWDFIKRNRFFGMIIPKQYGGLGFSALAHSCVVTKLSSRSVTAAVTVMVPNSLGPAELLLHYGTDDQKEYYLPRLAKGKEIPCFALTGPEAGSDAAATQSIGIVKRGSFNGEEVIGLEINWRKRYITLGPVSTIIGLAFQMKDPDGILGEVKDYGITCALIPSNLPGIDIGKRHDPLGIPFFNGPNTGEKVFVPIDYIIGGRERAGQGWKMLMESLAAGRSISLPALSVGGAQLCSRVVSAYSTIREQFDTPIGRFEGIEEPLSRIGGMTYLMNAARIFTAGSVDQGEKPSVPSAIVKAYLTEGMRKVIIDSMDIRAGAAICRGPRNIIASLYAAAPIGITVEGANILTRSMIIYGQGAIRCHPYVLKEMVSVAENDLKSFDNSFWGHVFFTLKNSIKTPLYGVIGAFSSPKDAHPQVKKYYRKLTRMSCAFSLVSDSAMAVLGGTLKRKEKISGRLADALAWMYLASASLKFFNSSGSKENELPFVKWSVEYSLYQIQVAIVGILDNFPIRIISKLLRISIFPLGTRYRYPSDDLGADMAQAMLEDPDIRQVLSNDIYIPSPNDEGLGKLESVLNQKLSARSAEKKVRLAIRKGKLDRAPGGESAKSAMEKGIISPEEYDQIIEAIKATDEIIQVDAFGREEYKTLR